MNKQQGEKFKILIIEDGDLNQKLLQDALRDAYQVITAASAKTAYEAIGKYHPHLILLDIILPDANGFDILEVLKKDSYTSSIPVIIITGLNNDHDEEKGLLLGAADYIRKPFNSTIVKARVDIHIQIVRQMQTIERLSFFDTLTGLPNRRKFDYQMEYEWQQAIRKQTCLGLMMMDLDSFKVYNDTYGHMQGDEVLKATAGAIKGCLHRATDVSCRWGGEEFAVLIAETQPDEVFAMAEKIRSKIEKMDISVPGPEGTTHITISVGAIAKIPRRGDSVTEFIKAADDLLYKAKANGKNRVCC